jgi:hypothetical protein
MANPGVADGHKINARNAIWLRATRDAQGMQFLQLCHRKFPLAFSPLRSHFALQQISPRRDTCRGADFRAERSGKRVFGSLRLPDVKPPCSYWPELTAPAIFFARARPRAIAALQGTR